MIRAQPVLRDSSCPRDIIDTLKGDRHSPFRPARDLGFVDLGRFRQRRSRHADAVKFEG